MAAQRPTVRENVLLERGNFGANPPATRKSAHDLCRMMDRRHSLRHASFRQLMS
jgi:hypothetical protein